MNPDIACTTRILRGPRMGSRCDRKASFVVAGYAEFVCDTHAHAWLRPGLVRLARWDRNAEQWS